MHGYGFDGTYSWARKMSATDVGTETPSKRSLAQVLLLVRVPLLPV